MILPYSLSRCLCFSFGCVYPAYASFKAIKNASTSSANHADNNNASNQLSPWLMYWIVYNGFSTLEYFSNTFLFWIPFYEEIRLITTLWLVLPQTRGSFLLYHQYVHPFLEENEAKIDATWNQILQTAKHPRFEIFFQVFSTCSDLIQSGYTNFQHYLAQYSFNQVDSHHHPPPLPPSTGLSATRTQAFDIFSTGWQNTKKFFASFLPQPSVIEKDMSSTLNSTTNSNASDHSKMTVLTRANIGAGGGTTDLADGKKLRLRNTNLTDPNHPQSSHHESNLSKDNNINSIGDLHYASPFEELVHQGGGGGGGGVGGNSTSSSSSASQSK